MPKPTILALLLFLVGCSTPTGNVANDNPNGGYFAVAPYYQVNGGVLYATDGEHSYWLQRPYVRAGNIGGASVASGEVWLRVDGSNTQGYYRSPASFRNQHVKPEFIAY